jgi:hypothetical protein
MDGSEGLHRAIEVKTSLGCTCKPSTSALSAWVFKASDRVFSAPRRCAQCKYLTHSERCNGKGEIRLAGWSLEL